MTQPENEIQDVMQRLETLAPAAGETPRPAPQALALLQRQVEPAPGRRFNLFTRRFPEMFKRRGVAVALSVVLLVVLLFSFPAVRATARDFLGLFRVQKFAAISITPQQMALLERMESEGLTPGEFEVVNEPGAAAPAGSLAEAAATVGITVRTPTALGEPDEIYVIDGGNGRLIIDLEGARAIVEAAGADPSLLPDSLDGARVFVAVFPGVQQVWGEDTLFMQAESPLVEYPSDLDAPVLAEAMLQVLGVEERQARRLARRIDWTSTLLLPIPEDMAAFSEVTVDGESGIGLSSLDGQHNALIWQKEGILYMLTGPQDLAELNSLADSLSDI